MPETFGAGFSIDIANLKAGLSQANRLIRESESEFKAAAAGMDDWTESQEGLEARIKHLNNSTDLQKKKIKALEKQYQENIDKGIDPMSSSMVTLRTNINKEQAALNKNEKELRDQTDALKNLGKEVNDTAEDFDKAGDNATSFGDIVKGNVVADLVVGGIKALASGVRDMASSFKDATLEAAAYADEILTLATQTGLSTEQLQEYQYMSELIDVSLDTITGSMAKLTKNMNTAKKGTGDAADAFKALGVKITDTDGSLRNNQDVFNDTIDALAKIENETQRDAYAMSIFGKSAQDLNPLIAQGGDALAGFAEEAHEVGYVLEEDALGALGSVDDASQRLTRSFESMKNNLVAKYAPQIESGMKKLSKVLDKAFEKLEDDILPAVKDGFKWVIDNRRYIEGAIQGAFSLFIGTKLVLGVSKAITGFKTLFATITAFTTTNPIGLLATGVGLLVGGIVALTVASRDEKTATDEAIEANQEFIESMNDRKEAYDEVVRAAEEAAASDLAELGQVEKLNSELKTLVDEKGKVKKADEERVNFILGELNEAFGTEYKLVDGVVQKYADLEKQIDSVIEKKKAEIMLQPLEAAYTEAVQNQAQARADLIKASQDYADQQDVVKTKEKELSDLTDEWHKKIQDPSFTHGESTDMQMRIFALEEEVLKEKELLKGQEEAYEGARSEVEKYYAAIDEYETAQSLIVSGKTQEAIDYMSSVSSAFEEGQKKFEDANLQQAYELEQNAKNARAWADEVDDMYKKGAEGVTKEMVKEAKDAATKAEKEWETVGKTIVEATATGVTNSYSLLEQVAVSTANDAADEAIESMRSRIMRAARLSAEEAEERYTPKTPKMATGGIVRSATNAIIGEAGAEAVLPLERNTGWMDMLAEKLSVKMSGTGKNGGSVVVNQTNNYSQAHSRYEIFKSREATAKAVKLAMREA